MGGNESRILLTHRFFYPDFPIYGYILEDMRKLFKENGFKVDVLSSQPSYKNKYKGKKEKIITKQEDGSTIYRLPVFKLKNTRLEKLLNYFWFPFITFWFLVFSHRYDVVTMATTPPVLYSFSVALVSKIRRRKLIYHMMDIHPEIGRLSGEFKNKFIFNILQWMDIFTCKTASRIVVLSSDMKTILLKRDEGLADKIEVINNYDVSSGEMSKNQFFTENTGKKRIVFTGNIGRYQNLESFVLALKEHGCLENFELVFVGEGTALAKLKQLAGSVSGCVRFVPHQPVAVARKIVSEADMGIVSLQNDVIQYAYPSKTMTYLAEGTPILLCVDSDSEISSFIQSENIGISLAPSDTDHIYEVYKELNTGALEFDREHIRKVFNNNFSKEEFDKKFSNLINDLMEEK